jgi:hypothetical protein
MGEQEDEVVHVRWTKVGMKPLDDHRKGSIWKSNSQNSNFRKDWCLQPTSISISWSCANHHTPSVLTLWRWSYGGERRDKGSWLCGKKKRGKRMMALVTEMRRKSGHFGFWSMLDDVVHLHGGPSWMEDKIELSCRTKLVHAKVEGRSWLSDKSSGQILMSCVKN